MSEAKVSRRRIGRADELIELVLPMGLDKPDISPKIFDEALRVYLAGERLDMRALAARAGVGRATLYRRAGNRDQLIDQIEGWRSRRALAAGLRTHYRRSGAALILGVVESYLRGVQSDVAIKAFLTQDPEAAMGILTGARSIVQQGLVEAVERLIDREVDRGTYATTLDHATLAYAIVRIGEGFLYADVIADRPPAVDQALVVVEALLRGLDPDASRRPRRR